MTVNKVQRSGNSFYVVLPASYLKSLGIRVKDYVVVRVKKNSIEIKGLRVKEGKN